VSSHFLNTNKKKRYNNKEKEAYKEKYNAKISMAQN
jgi:hypothetical protein